MPIPRPLLQLAPLALVAAAQVVSAAPANDDPTGAYPLPTAGAAATVVLLGATMAPTDPSCGTPTYQSVWYRYTSSVDQFIQARVGATTGSTALRPRLSVWSGAPGALAPVQCHPDAHEVQFDATAGTTYYLQVYSPSDGGETTLNLNFNPHAFVNPWSAVPPPNDLFWYAEEIPSVPWNVIGNVGAAAGDSGYDPFTPCSVSGGFTTCYPYGDTLWYRFTATSTQQLDALVASGVSSPVVQVMTGTLDDPVLVANSSTPGLSKPGATRFTTEPGVTYMIEFASGGSEHTSDLYGSLVLRPSPPVTTGTVAAVKFGKIYYRWVWTDPFYQRQTHVVISADVTCDAAVPSVKVGFVIAQAAALGSASANADCSSGSGRATADTLVSNSFTPGLASVALSAAAYDSNFYETAAAAPVYLKRSVAP